MPTIPGLGGSPTETFGAVAAVTAAYVDGGETAEAESFGCGMITEDDWLELSEALENKKAKALVFPGVVGAWASEDDALGQCSEATAKEKGLKRALFKFKGISIATIPPTI